MSWFGDGFSNLQGKITTFTREVLSDVVESVQAEEDEVEENNAGVSVTSWSQDPNEEIQNEISRIQQKNQELVTQNHELESQVSTLSRQYRNLLSSQKGNEVISSHEDASRTNSQLQVAEAWKREVQNWLTSQSIELPHHLENFQPSNGADSHDYQQECLDLQAQVSQLEEQLIALDQDHQTTLDVALSSLTEIKGHNQQLQFKVSELMKDRQALDQTQLELSEECQNFKTRVSTLEEQLTVSDEQRHNDLETQANTCKLLQDQNQQLQLQLNEERASHNLLSSKRLSESEENSNGRDQEVVRLEDDHLHLQKEISYLQNQFKLLTHKLTAFECINEENQGLNDGAFEQEKNLNSSSQILLANDKVETLSPLNSSADHQLNLIKGLAEENEELKSSLNELQLKIHQLEENSEKLETFLQRSASDTDELTMQISSVNSLNESLNHQLNDFKEKIDENIVNIQSKSLENDNLVSEKLQLTEELNARQISLETEQEKLKESSLYCQKLQEELKQQKEDLELQIQQLQVNIEKLESQQSPTDADEHIKQISALNSLNESLTDQLEELKQKINENLVDIESKSLENDKLVSDKLQLTEELNARQISLETKQEKLQESSVYCQQLQEELKQRKQDLELKIQQLEENGEKLQSQQPSTNADELIQQISALNSLNESLTDQLEDLKKKIDENVVNIQSKSLENDELVSDKLRLTEDLKTHQISLETEQEKLKESSLYCQQLQEELKQQKEDLELQIQQLQVNIEKLESQPSPTDSDEHINQISALNSLNESLTQQMEDLKKKIEENFVDIESKSLENDKLVSDKLQLTEELNARQISLETEQENLKESSVYCQQLEEELKQQKQNLQEKLDGLNNTVEELRAYCQSLKEKVEGDEETKKHQVEEYETYCKRYEDEKEVMRRELADIKIQLDTKTNEDERLMLNVKELQQEKEQLNLTLQAFQLQREQLVQTVQQKHQEAVSYHSEAQRMAKICEDLQVRLSDYGEINEELSRYRVEYESMKTIQQQLQGEIDRLRSHLLSVEENYTIELLKCAEKEKVLKDTLQAAEEKVSDQWRNNDKMSSLKEKYRQTEIEKKRLETSNQTLELSIEKLQHVLDQFTRERDRDIVVAQRDLAQKLSRAESLHKEKDNDIVHLRNKLAEAQLGLEAAGRLTQQLDNTTAALSVAKEEVRVTEEDLARSRQQIHQLQTGTDSKVDRSLVKNLVVGYFSAPQAKRVEVMRIIATVLDFTSDERNKTGLMDATSGAAGWASGILKMSRTRNPSGNSSSGDADKSLSEAFINFLETESVRHSPPKLPSQLSIGEDTASTTSISAVMPTFHPGRNEPTILRDALRDSES